MYKKSIIEEALTIKQHIHASEGQDKIREFWKDKTPKEIEKILKVEINGDTLAKFLIETHRIKSVPGYPECISKEVIRENNGAITEAIKLCKTEHVRHLLTPDALLGLEKKNNKIKESVGVDTPFYWALYTMQLLKGDPRITEKIKGDKLKREIKGILKNLNKEQIKKLEEILNEREVVSNLSNPYLNNNPVYTKEEDITDEFKTLLRKSKIKSEEGITL